MDYKEKYDTALGIAKMWHKNTAVPKECKVIFEQMFPELKESEDERIRKSIIAILDKYIDDNNTIKPAIMNWLEKQGEQKLADKVEPKFNIDDWIVGNDGIFKITQYEDEYGYELTDTNGCVVHFVSPNYVESNFHLWTIADAKDGDVLVCETDEVEWIFIYREIIPADSVVPHDLLRYHFLLEGNYLNCNGVSAMITDDYELYLKPATKEQRELLFSKMKEAGYE